MINVNSLSSKPSEKKGVKKIVKNTIYRLILCDDYKDEYQGYEEQGICFEEWKTNQTIQNNHEKSPNDLSKKRFSEYLTPEKQKTLIP